MTAIRQEIRFSMLGEEYSVRPDFDTIDRIEQRVGIIHLLNQFEAGDVKIRDLAWVLHSAIEAAGYRGVSYADVGEAVTSDMGIDSAAKTVSEILVAAVGAGPEGKPAKKQKPRRTSTGGNSTA